MVEKSSFSGLLSLNILSLQHNQLKDILQMVFEPARPTSLNQLILNDNNLECDCQLEWLWIADGSWVTLSNPTLTLCAAPVPLANVAWSSLTIDDLKCPGKI